MKNLLCGLLLILFSCSGSDDTEKVLATVPNAPSDLTGSPTSATSVNLIWTDLADNETGFKIERKTPTGAYVLIHETAADVVTYSDEALAQGSTYVYRVSSFNDIGNSTSFSNELTISTYGLPTITTTIPTSITTTSAVSGGNISNDGGMPVLESGIVWSTNHYPTTALSTKTTDGLTTGTFTSALSGLMPATLYYVRSYATNALGTSYGEELYFYSAANTTAGPDVVDIDGNTYHTVQICNQVWTTSNLNVSRYRNGDIIPQATSVADWYSGGRWCYYQYDTANGPVYGKLYNWYALIDPRGLAPLGYHIPTKEEVNTMAVCLGGLNVAAAKMKESGIANWFDPNDGSNTSGFNALPSGLMYISNNFGTGVFQEGFSQNRMTGCWWTTSTGSASSFGYRYYYKLSYDIPSLKISAVTTYEMLACAIRLVKD